MFIASGYLACEDGGRLVRKSLGLIAAVVVGERRRGTRLTKIYLLVTENYFTTLWNQLYWIDIFDTKIWAFESIRLELRFTNYSSSKFTKIIKQILEKNRLG